MHIILGKVLCAVIIASLSLLSFPQLGMSDTSAQTGRSDDDLFQYTINKTWDSGVPADNAEIHLKFYKLPGENADLVIEIDAPYYADPVVPEELPVGSTDELWNYEVVEVFFLSESEKIYLETEWAPKGHYLLLQLDTDRNILDKGMPIDDYKTEINEDIGRWRGRVVVPAKYFPKNVNKFNAYAIHKSDPNRVYMSLWPVPPGKYTEPNFHRLEYFQDIELKFP